MRFFWLLILMFMCSRLLAQNCTTLGQTPSTAFPVCGLNTFAQSNVPICSSHNLTVPGCTGDGAAYADKNPFWYRFTCYQTGTLGFLVTPNNANDDYDWMLYDITGRNANDVFTDPSLIITGNWAGTYGVTGASGSGVNFIQCASNPADNLNSFSTMPTIIQGHTYLLLVSHFSDNQFGYKLSFGGGTAVINDPQVPKMAKSIAGCGGVTVTVIMNKKIKCSSLATNGSDFVLSPAAATIVSARGLGCSNSFDMDTVVLTMSNALPPGNYTVSIKNGSDGNTLLDNCDNSVPVGDHFAVTVDPVQPTPMDNIKPVACAPDKLELVFRRPINCNSIAANGSDFRVTGSTPVSVTGASGNCVNGVTTSIFVQLSAPILTAGNYQVHLQPGNDGNTIIDECGQQTPAGAAVPFTTSDTVNADFTYEILYGCKADTVNFQHNTNNGVNEWKWNFNNEGSSTLQDPQHIFNRFGPKQVTLAVSNGVCKDTTVSTVMLDNFLDAHFLFPEILCPQEKAVFTDSSIGNIISWNWDFGNGNGSSLQNPFPESYPTVAIGSKIYNIRLIVENNIHCFDTAVHQMKVVNSCIIDVPNAFTPNGDGKNDYLYPLNAWKARDLKFNIYNRYGQLVFSTNNWTKKWDGRINGALQSTGVFVWMLQYTLIDTGEKINKRGTTVLLR
ncbi:gliding motility-associated C-terminal domain-containing protein [Longitalea luteola]|uniref:T9SS type B sorting domain-containing protein n=1 Tax=Longitalea luteola TaxID=2812563 RepID=UPI001F61C86D|nr:gliding motility-associated C-terminal domain-containing protein [Longitalea luteola]